MIQTIRKVKFNLYRLLLYHLATNCMFDRGFLGCVGEKRQRTREGGGRAACLLHHLGLHLLALQEGDEHGLGLRWWTIGIDEVRVN